MKQISEEDAAEIVEFLKDRSQYFKASLVAFLYNFYRLQTGIVPQTRKKDNND